MSWNYNKWYEVAKILPDDGAIVWTRIDRWSGSPFKATFDATSQIFTSLDSSLVVPAYIVSRFKPIFIQQLPLDPYPTAIGGFSFRKLLTNYNGVPMTVFNANTNTTEAIDFLNDYINTQQIIDFSQSAVLRISELNNQVVPNQTASNPTNTERPTIYNGSSFISLNNKVYADWGQHKLTTDNLLQTNQYTIIAVIQPRFLNLTRNICSQWTGANVPGRAKLMVQITGYLGNRQCLATCTTKTSNQPLSTNPTVLSIRVNGTQLTFGFNGIEENTILTSDVTLDNFNFVIGGIDSTGEYMNAYFAELLVFSSDLGSDINGIIDDCKTFYGIV